MIDGLIDRTVQKQQQALIILSDAVYTRGKSLQDGLEDVYTYRIILASVL